MLSKDEILGVFELDLPRPQFLGVEMAASYFGKNAGDLLLRKVSCSPDWRGPAPTIRTEIPAHAQAERLCVAT